MKTDGIGLPHFLRLSNVLLLLHVAFLTVVATGWSRADHEFGSPFVGNIWTNAARIESFPSSKLADVVMPFVFPTINHRINSLAFAILGSYWVLLLLFGGGQWY